MVRPLPKRVHAPAPPRPPPSRFSPTASQHGQIRRQSLEHRRHRNQPQSPTIGGSTGPIPRSFQGRARSMPTPLLPPQKSATWLASRL